MPTLINLDHSNISRDIHVAVERSCWFKLPAHFKKDFYEKLAMAWPARHNLHDFKRFPFKPYSFRMYFPKGKSRCFFYTIKISENIALHCCIREYCIASLIFIVFNELLFCSYTFLVATLLLTTFKWLSFKSRCITLWYCKPIWRVVLSVTYNILGTPVYPCPPPI